MENSRMNENIDWVLNHISNTDRYMFSKKVWLEYIRSQNE